MRVKWRMAAPLVIVGLLAGSITGTTISADEADDPGEPARDVGDVPLNTPVGDVLGQPPNFFPTCGQVYSTISCTVFSPFFQTPAQTPFGTIRQVSVTTGPTPGPMRIVVLRDSRSLAAPPGQLPAPSGCCVVQAQTDTFVLPPNQTTTIAVNLPMQRGVISVNNEQVEFLDHLGIAMLEPNVSIPIRLRNEFNGVPMLMSGTGTVWPNGQGAQFGGFGINDGIQVQPILGYPTFVGTFCPSQNRDGTGVRLGSGEFVQNVCPGSPGTPGSPGSPGSPGTPGGSGSSEFVGITPARFLDTRGGNTADGRFSGGGKLQGGQEIELDVAGRDDVPDGAEAVVLNVTVSDPENFGFITAYPCGIRRPEASNINFAPDQTIPNSVIVKVGDGGKVCLYSDQTTHLIADVGGFLPETAEYRPLDPARYLDTRGAPTFDGRFSTGTPLAGGQEIALDVSGRGDVPDDADAVVLNVTVTGPAAPGFITVYPCGTSRPEASNLNYVPGQTIANTVVSKVGGNGRVCLFSDQTTHLLADVGGAFPSGSDFTSLDPKRYLDTRGAPTFDGGFSTGAELQGGQEIALDVAGRGDVPDDADAVVMNVTVNDPDNFGFVTVYPCGVDRPNASNLNFAPGQTIPNSVVVKVGDGGRVCLFSDQTTHLFADVSGYFD